MSETQEANIQTPQPSTPPGEPIAAPAAARRKPRRNTILIVGAIGLVLAAVCLCVVACVAVLGSDLVQVALEWDDVEAVIDQFMQAMVQRDSDAAYALFSTRAQRTTSLSDVEELLEGNNYVVFAGYQSASIMSLNIGQAFYANPDVPQGTIARVSGMIAYDGGYTGSFNAVLEQENGEWRMSSIYITVPPDKFEEPMP